MTTILYSTGCPRCNILKKKLDAKNIPFSEFTDKEQMIAMGFDDVPVLSVDDKLMDFAAANEWVNNYCED